MEDKIKALIAEKLGKKKDAVTEASRLIEDLGADSLDIVELIMEFEDQFDLVLTDEDAAKLKTVGDVIKFIKNVKK